MTDDLQLDAELIEAFAYIHPPFDSKRNNHDIVVECNYCNGEVVIFNDQCFLLPRSGWIKKLAVHIADKHPDGVP